MTDTLSLEPKVQNSSASILRIRNFRLLWIGEGISLLGDQFYMIALPWLVLTLTGKPLVVRLGRCFLLPRPDIHCAAACG